jgi:type II secretory pathway pseudopilin PulG
LHGFSFFLSLGLQSKGSHSAFYKLSCLLCILTVLDSPVERNENESFMSNDTVVESKNPESGSDMNQNRKYGLILIILLIVVVVISGLIGLAIVKAGNNIQEENLKNTAVLTGCVIQKHDSAQEARGVLPIGRSVIPNVTTVYYVISTCGVMEIKSEEYQKQLTIGDTYTLEVTKRDDEIIAAVNNKDIGK